MKNRHTESPSYKRLQNNALRHLLVQTRQRYNTLTQIVSRIFYCNSSSIAIFPFRSATAWGLIWNEIGNIPISFIGLTQSIPAAGHSLYRPAARNWPLSRSTRAFFHPLMLPLWLDAADFSPSERTSRMLLFSKPISFVRSIEESSFVNAPPFRWDRPLQKKERQTSVRGECIPSDSGEQKLPARCVSPKPIGQYQAR